jgi:hypothetical protein
MPPLPVLCVNEMVTTFQFNGSWLTLPPDEFPAYPQQVRGWLGRRSRHGYYCVQSVGDVLTVCFSSWFEGHASWSRHWHVLDAAAVLQKGGVRMASKYIARAVASAAPDAINPQSLDPFLFKNRPALQEFMAWEGDETEGFRELSPLMLCVGSNGMRAGLRDTESGGWLWREADTVKEALDALEKALVAGNVRWSVPGGNKGKRSAKRG